MITAQVVAELMRAGVTGDALVDALRRIEAASQVTQQPSRVTPETDNVTPGALRQRRWREARKRQNAPVDAAGQRPVTSPPVDGNVTGDAPPASSASPLVPPLSPAPLSPPIIPPPPPPPPAGKLAQIGKLQPEDGGPNRKGTRLAADFVPGQAAEDLARELKFTKADWTMAQQEFRDYWAGVPGAKGYKLDWQATFRNSIRRYAERKPYGKSNGQSVMAAAFDRLEGKISEYRGADDGADQPQQPDDSGLAY